MLMNKIPFSSCLFPVAFLCFSLLVSSFGL